MKILQRNGATLQLLIPTQHQERNCNCNSHLRGFQKKKQHQSLDYNSSFLQEYYAPKSPVTITENNSPEQKKTKCNNFVPNDNSLRMNVRPVVFWGAMTLSGWTLNWPELDMPKRVPNSAATRLATSSLLHQLLRM